MPISVENAQNIIFEQLCPCAVLHMLLLNASGYCLAEDVLADRDLPPSDRAAMDGYAVRSDDIQTVPTHLRCIGEIAAGSVSHLAVTSGTCVQIFTGAPIPPGANAVIKVEDTSEKEGQITFHVPATAGVHIRAQGEESKKGSIILKKGAMLDAVQIGLCASVGKEMVPVYARPRVTILCTGKELRDVHEPVAPHQIRNSNGPSLCSGLSRAGYTGVSYQNVPDNCTELVERIREAIHAHDVVILTGGVSAGKYDYVPEAIAQAGATVQFHGVAMKPGRPMLYATYKNTCHLFGLPGNPLSVLTCLHTFVLPALRCMSGIPAEQCRSQLRLPLSDSMRVKGGRTEYILARVEYAIDGSRVRSVSSHGSADLAAAADADGVIVVPPGIVELAQGQPVDFISWRPVSCK